MLVSFSLLFRQDTSFLMSQWTFLLVQLEYGILPLLSPYLLTIPCITGSSWCPILLRSSCFSNPDITSKGVSISAVYKQNRHFDFEFIVTLLLTKQRNISASCIFSVVTFFFTIFFILLSLRSLSILPEGCFLFFLPYSSRPALFLKSSGFCY